MRCTYHRFPCRRIQVSYGYSSQRSEKSGDRCMQSEQIMIVTLVSCDERKRIAKSSLALLKDGTKREFVRTILWPGQPHVQTLLKPA